MVLAIRPAGPVVVLLFTVAVVVLLFAVVVLLFAMVVLQLAVVMMMMIGLLLLHFLFASRVVSFFSFPQVAWWDADAIGRDEVCC